MNHLLRSHAPISDAGWEVLDAEARQRLGTALAIVITGIVFGLVHFEELQYLGLAGFGMVLAYLAYRTGRLGPSILAHVAFNTTTIIAFVLQH